MAGYNDTRELIIKALMGRSVGTEIQPEDHQAYALNMLDYIRSVELVSSSTLVGLAEESTVPVQPDQGKVCYIAGVGQDRTVTFSNFIDDEGNPISITTGEMEGVFVILLWNMEHWVAYTFNTNIISSAESANFYYGYNIRKTYASVAAMNADSVNPIGTDGRLIKIGELATVVNSTTPAENGYYSYEGSENGWLLQSGFSFEIVQTTGTDVNKAMSQKAVTDEIAQLAGDVSEIQTDVAFKSGKYITISDLTLVGYVDKTNGILGGEKNFNRSGKLKVSPLKRYIIRTAVTPTMQAGTALFNASGSFLRSINLEPNKDNVVKFDSDVDYIIVSGRVGNEQYVKEILDNIPSSEGRILESVELSPEYNITGYIDKTTGLPTSTIAKSTDFIDVSKYDVLHITPAQQSYLAASLMLYDENKEMVERVTVESLSEVVFNVNDRGIKYFRASNYTGTPIIKGGIYKVKANYAQVMAMEKLNFDVSSGYVLKSNGVIVNSGPDFIKTEYIPINSEDTYLIENEANSAWTQGHAVYNEYKQFIRALNIPNGDVSIKFNEGERYVILTSSATKKPSNIYVYINKLKTLPGDRIADKNDTIEHQVTSLTDLDIVWNTGYLKDDGVVVNNQWHQYSDPIDVSSHQFIAIYSDRDLIPRTASNIWLDAESNAIGQVEASTRLLKILEKKSNAKYIQLSRAKNNTKVFVSGAEVINKDLNTHDDLDRWFKITDRASLIWDNGYYFGDTGTFVRGAGFAVAKVILSGYTHVVLYSGRPADSPSTNAFLDINGDVVEYAKSDTASEAIFKIPNGAVSLVITWRTGFYKPRVLLCNSPTISSRAMTFDDYNRDLSSLLSPNSFISGYKRPNFNDNNSSKTEIIRPSAIITKNIFFDESGMIPKDGVSMAFIDGSLMLIANGKRYLFNLTRI